MQVSARMVIIVALLCLGVAAGAWALVALGLTGFKIVGFVAIVSGVANIVIALLALVAGKLKDDLRKKSELD